MARRESDEATEESMAIASYLGDRLNNNVFGERLNNNVLFGTKTTYDLLDTASIFRITQRDIELLYGRRCRNPPPALMTQEQKNYLENIRKWSEQLPRRGEEEEQVKKPAEESQTLVEKPPAGGETAEEEDCGGDESESSS